MPKIKELIQPPPEPEGDGEQQLAALRDYLVKITQELYYLLTHLEADNINDSTFQKISEMIPRPYVGQPMQDGDPSPGQSSQWARGDHRHGHDRTKADVTALEAAREALEGALELEADAREAHEDDTDNPHEVTAAQTGAMPNTATMDDIQNGTTYAKTTAAQVAQIGTNQTNIGTIEGKIPSAASQSNQLADKAFVTDSITQGTAIFRGSFASKAALLAVQWQTTDPNAANYVSNNDYAVVLDDETQSGECWRYIYVTGTGWTPQYRINESPLTQAQLDALNSGATAAIIGSVADKLDKTGDGKDVTATFTAASTRANISTGEKLSVLFGKIAKWFSDLGTAAFRAVTGSITSGSTDLVESGAVYTGLAGKQPKITASGILKGDGAGGVSTATPETDYATPNQIPTTPADIGALPADGTAKKAYNLAPSHSLSGDSGWYKVLTLNVTSGTTRSLDVLISHSYSPTVGILRIYLNKISTGQTVSSRVNWLITTISVEYVRWEIETVNDTSTMSVYFYKSTNNAGIVDFFLFEYKNRAATTRDLSSGAWLSEAVSLPETANIATADILNNAATADSATNALNDGNGDVIEAASYVKKKNGVYYAICNTPAATTIKSISIPEITGLVEGLCINIEFPNGITDSGTIVGIQLDVNGYGAVSLGIERGYNSFTPWTSYDAIGVVTAVYSQIGTQQGVPVYAWKVTNISHASNGFIGLTSLSNDVNSPHGYDEDGIPTAATPKAVKTAYDLAASKSKLVRFTAQAVSAASNAEIFRITDSDITTDTEVVSIEFADPSYITAGGSWTSYAGYVAFTGTCTAATTADVILKI